MNSDSNCADPQIESELQKFIQLLQKGQFSHSERSSRDMGKLSTIFSASEPSSSSGDKQNSNSEANRSFSSTQLMEKDCQFIKQLEATGLTLHQKKCLDKIRKLVFGLKGLVVRYQNQYSSLQRDYQLEKKGTDELLKAMEQMDQAQKEVWRAYNILNDNYKEQKTAFETLEVDFIKMQEKLNNYAKDNEFMKKLVIVANENYELLEKKCRNMEKQNQGQQSSRSILSRSSKTKRQSYSPSGSDLVNLSPRKEQFEGVYRKMVLRTLKSKCKKQNN